MIMTTSEVLLLNMAFPSFQKSQVSCTKDSFISLDRNVPLPSVAIWSCFHEKIFEWQLFGKKCAKESFFSACEKGAFFSISVYFGNMPNFAGLWCPNHLTHRDSWGIIGKIISVAFIWYLVVLCVTASLVTIASWKSGLILSSLKMLISVLSNKAVLGKIQA